MNETEVQFRTATFGGFQKQDVMIYIETASREHREKLEELQRQLDEAGAARASLEEELAAARAQSGEQEQELQRLREACAAAQAEAADRDRALEQARSDLAQVQAQLAGAQAQAAGLEAELAKASPAAEAYERIKDRTAGIELEAHCRAQTVQAEAEERVKRLQTDAEEWLHKVWDGYGALRAQVDAAIGRAQGELEQVNGLLRDVSGALSGQAEQLERLTEGYAAEAGHRPPDPLPLDGE